MLVRWKRKPGWCRNGCGATPTAFSFAGTHRAIFGRRSPAWSAEEKKRHFRLGASPKQPFVPRTLAQNVPFTLGLPIPAQGDLLRVYLQKHQKNRVLTTSHLMCCKETFVSRGAPVSVDALFVQVCSLFSKLAPTNLDADRKTSWTKEWLFSWKPLCVGQNAHDGSIYKGRSIVVCARLRPIGALFNT